MVHLLELPPPVPMNNSPSKVIDISQLRKGMFVQLDLGWMSHPFAVGSFGLGMMAGALSRPHDGTEVIATMIGVAVVALGHDLNRRARH